jgi:hypothetical protein
MQSTQFTAWGRRSRRSPHRYGNRVDHVRKLPVDRRGPPADGADLDALALRLSAATGLPPAVARARVERLAISAQARVDDGADR